MSEIKNFKQYDLPREKALREGIESLSDIELIAILLDTGSKNKTVLEVASDLINKNGGLRGLLNLSFNELCEFEGVKSSKALKILTLSEISRRMSLQSLEDNRIWDEEVIARYFIEKMHNLTREESYLVCLSSHGKLLSKKKLFTGGTSVVQISYKEIIHEALKYKTKSIYLIHNHPGENCLPSKQDMEITINLQLILATLNLKLEEHIIIFGNHAYGIMKKRDII